MNRNVIFAALAVLTLFVGYICVDSFPTFAPLVLFLACGLCYVFGYLTYKALIKPVIDFKDGKIDGLLQKNNELSKTNGELRAHIDELADALDSYIKKEEERIALKKAKKKNLEK